MSRCVICLRAVGALVGVATAAASAFGQQSIFDFSVYSGTGGSEIGSNVLIEGGLVGSEGNVVTKSGTMIRDGIRAKGTLNPVNVSSGGEIGTSTHQADIIVNQDLHFDGPIYGDVHVGNDGTIHAFGSVNKVGGVAGNLWTGNDVELKNGSNVQGDVHYGGTFTGPGTVAGSKINSAAGLLTFAGITGFPTPGSYTTLGIGDFTDSAVIGPGTYQDIDVGSNKQITLSSGDYQFNQITANASLDLLLDLSSGSKLNITVADDVFFGSGMNVLVKTPTSGGFVDVDDLLTSEWVYTGLVRLDTQRTFTMTTDGDWFGTVFASTDVAGGGNIEIQIGTKADIWGALYSLDQIQIANDSTLHFVPIPEPASWVLAALGTCMLLLSRHRRRV